MKIFQGGQLVKGVEACEHCDPPRHHPHQVVSNLRLRVRQHGSFPGSIYPHSSHKGGREGSIDNYV